MSKEDTLISDCLKGWRFLFNRGFIEGFGHISVRLPDSDKFLITRHSMGARGVADDLLTVDINGKQLDGKGKLPGESPIHLEIYKVRPDVNCVLHYHGMYSTAFTTSKHTLKPIHLMGSLFHTGIPIYPDPKLVHDDQRGAALAKSLGPHRAVLMKAHGVAMTGANLLETIGGAFLFEQNAERAVICASMGEPQWLDEQTIAECAAELYPYGRVWAMVEAEAND